MESLSVMTLATLLDPRFKTVGFFSPQKATEAVKRLKSECAAEMRSHEPDPAEDMSAAHGSEPSSGMKTHSSVRLYVYFCGLSYYHMTFFFSKISARAQSLETS